MTATLIAIFSQSYHRHNRTYLKQIATHENYVVNQISLEIEQQIDMMVADVRILSQLNELNDYIATGDRQLLDKIADEFLLFAQSKPYYLQLRFLNAQGREVVRIDTASGHAYKLNEEQLQDKSQRDYFQQAIQLKNRNVYFSRFDLNIEKGKIVVPFQPTLRCATPVYADNETCPCGAVVLNYNGEKLLGLLEQGQNIAQEKLLLINNDGYWLHGIDSEDEWGFVVPQRQHKRFAVRFPEAWPQLRDGARQITTSQGAFAVRSIHAQFAEYILNPPHWFVVSFVSDAKICRAKMVALKHQFTSAVILLLLGLVPAWIVSLFIAEIIHKHHDLQIKVNYDPLTGLANRVLFNDRLEQLLWISERNTFRFAVLFCDLDGFKAINDTLGHDAGDQLLIALGKRMKGLVRKSDTVARLGGDEFAILLANIRSAQVAEMIATKVVEQLCQPVDLDNGRAQVGGSVGIALYPDHASACKDLVACADQAMYAAKRSGKGRYYRYDQITTQHRAAMTMADRSERANDEN
ncbi:sensor domain-containing diguanylate cyclase [uncultured Desulfuromonas sp.]|uniref:sensor domain-containing diguanylate cyclase n=1 Tax=uncultured Desulfuromonas sp. TaxID=181013 RepID=UPI002AAB20B4|nr:sensor domain-containing diguanylate cyclase [uncultured Desulfuromonas sp.]